MLLPCQPLCPPLPTSASFRPHHDVSYPPGFSKPVLSITQAFASLSLDPNPGASGSINRAFGLPCLPCSKLTVPQGHPEGLLKHTLVGLTTRASQSACCWFGDHTQRTWCDSTLEMLFLVIRWFNIKVGLRKCGGCSVLWVTPSLLHLLPSLPFVSAPCARQTWHCFAC